MNGASPRPSWPLWVAGIVALICVQVWAPFDKFPSYARSVWHEWALNWGSFLHMIGRK